ncbi:MAG: hypothetical protein KatS3mg113_1100 [Planctomycetaceae bacterium]|nr:MAG: hypothetical protein KatS3mg113_1100 [Planctomycetaceae bacterium]
MVDELRRVQTWFQRQMMGTPSLEDPSAREVLCPSIRCTVEQRLAVYQQAYVARLVECLQTDYPAVRACVGDEVFLTWCVAYLQAYPSRSYTLADLGAHFPTFLRAARPPREHDTPDFADFLAELAAYERLVHEVFLAKGPEQTPPWSAARAEESYLTLPNVDLADRYAWRFVPYPCVRLLTASFPVHEVVSAVRRHQPVAQPAPQPTCLVLFRRDYVVRRAPLKMWEYRLLQAVFAGCTLDDAWLAVHHAAENQTAFPSPSEVADTFRRWGEWQLFAQVVPTPRTSS